MPTAVDYTVGVTPYHAKYWAYELTRRCPADSVDRLTTALVDAQVDLNPHQVDAALFAFRSPLSKGVLLADEVGLGKTIEAGLVISQKWAERKRRVLVIVPSNLRKQWHQELTEKFFLPCNILESKPYNDDIKRGQFRPLIAYDKDVQGLVSIVSALTALAGVYLYGRYDQAKERARKREEMKDAAAQGRLPLEPS